MKGVCLVWSAKARDSNLEMKAPLFSFLSERSHVLLVEEVFFCRTFIFFPQFKWLFSSTHFSPKNDYHSDPKSPQNHCKYCMDAKEASIAPKVSLKRVSSTNQNRQSKNIIRKMAEIVS